MFRKKLFAIRYCYKYFLTYILYGICLIAFVLYHPEFDPKSTKELKMSLKSYRGPTVLIQWDEKFRKRSMSYENVVTAERAEVQSIPSEFDMNDFILEKVTGPTCLWKPQL